MPALTATVFNDQKRPIAWKCSDCETIFGLDRVDAILTKKSTEQAAKADEQAGHPDEAIQKYQQIIKLDPALAAGYNNLGRLLYQQGRLDEAIQPLRQASKLDPK